MSKDGERTTYLLEARLTVMGVAIQQRRQAMVHSGIVYSCDILSASAILTLVKIEELRSSVLRLIIRGSKLKSEKSQSSEKDDNRMSGTGKFWHRRKHSIEIDTDILQDEFNQNAAPSVADTNTHSIPDVGYPSSSLQVQDVAQMQQNMREEWAATRIQTAFRGFLEKSRSVMLHTFTQDRSALAATTQRDPRLHGRPTRERGGNQPGPVKSHAHMTEIFESVLASSNTKGAGLSKEEL
ncbi:hypothetical protein F0562_001838 [Nyssa sinensis]|uniref:Uncharacterized protein n=1 Tax=Nyssa sinensis TaxID=561372 RepID=A0A5J5C5A5_9ASTE|nr:hypothetical protein F0562_001838 [Nyssa sinensis]